MTGEHLVLLLIGAVAQWAAAAGSIWLTWWAAQSRDPLPLRAVAMVLVIGPALLWPLMTFYVTLDSYGTVGHRALLFGVVGAGVAIVRALFLALWALLSKDRLYLRVGGGVIALLQVAGVAVQALGGLTGL